MKYILPMVIGMLGLIGQVCGAGITPGSYKVAYYVNFELSIDRYGQVIACEFQSADPSDGETRSATFRPSDAFISKACETFEQHRRKSASTSEPMQVRDYCVFSDSIPDSPLCPADPD
jgi:hypothetical protein